MQHFIGNEIISEYIIRMLTICVGMLHIMYRIGGIILSMLAHKVQSFQQEQIGLQKYEKRCGKI